MPDMILCLHPERIVDKMDIKASRLFEADSLFLIEKGACEVVKDIAILP